MAARLCLIPCLPPPPTSSGTDETNAEEVRESTLQPRLQLTLKGPNLPGVPDLEVDLADPEWTIFRAVQHLIQSSEMGSKQDKIRRIWEPMYIIVYKAAKEDSSSPKEVRAVFSFRGLSAAVAAVTRVDGICSAAVPA